MYASTSASVCSRILLLLDLLLGGDQLLLRPRARLRWSPCTVTTCCLAASRSASAVQHLGLGLGAFLLLLGDGHFLGPLGDFDRLLLQDFRRLLLALLRDQRDLLGDLRLLDRQRALDFGGFDRSASSRCRAWRSASSCCSLNSAISRSRAARTLATFIFCSASNSAWSRCRSSTFLRGRDVLLDDLLARLRARSRCARRAPSA